MKINLTFVMLASVGLGFNLNAQTPNFLWAKQIGGVTTTDRGYSIAVDNDGNVYTTGAFFGTADFNPSNDPNTGTFNLTAVGNYDIFISKLDASGNFLWAKNIGGNFADYGYSIVLDGNGFFYVTGYFQGVADFDPGSGATNLTSLGSEDVFVTKFSTSGNLVWAKQLGGTGSDIGYSIAINSIGNVSTTGSFKNTADFDPGSSTYNLTAGYIDIFVSTLDASGNFLWAKRMGGGFNGNGNTGSSGNSITTDNSGNVYTTGFFSATGDFDPGTETYNLTAVPSSTDIFVSKLDPSGNFIWAKQLGGQVSEAGNSITVDANGNIFLTGNFDGTADFNPSPFGVFNLTASQGDAFVSKLDANGDFIWAKRLGGVFPDKGTSIKLDGNGNIYTTGTFYGNGNTMADFDPSLGTYNLTSTGDKDVYISKLDPSGDFVWAIQMGGQSEDNSNSLYLDANGSIYTTGSFYGTSDFDPGNGIYNLTSGNDGFFTYEDVFISKLCQIETPTISGSPSFCQGGSTILTSNLANSYLWSTGATTQSITVSTSGNYSVITTNASGCTAASTILTVFANPVPTIMVNSPMICAGQSATLTASGATSYLWSNGLTSSSISVNPAATTTYTVTGTTSGCTSSPVSAQVTVNQVPTITVNSPTVCTGQSATLTANGATTYLWSNGMTGNSISVNPTVTTTYTVTGTTSGCTSLPVSVQVTVNQVPTVTVNSPMICVGQSATLTANGAANYLWSTGETSNSINVSPTTTTTYTVTGTTVGCSSPPVSAQIIVNQVPTVTVNNPTICTGQPVILTVNGATNYIWSNGATSNSITVSPTSTTTYTVTGTTMGCSSAPASALVTVNPSPTVSVEGATICAGQSATLTANGATNYVWSNGVTTNSITISPASTTTYTVTGTTAGCLSAPASAQVTVNSLPNVTVDNQTICAGQSATLTANGAANYLWSTGETSNNITISPTSTTTYTVSGTTAGCLSAPASAEVTVNSFPTVTVNNQAICAGQSATLTANGATNYVWSNGATTNSITVSPKSTTTYMVTGTTAGCASTPVSTQVTVNLSPIINLGSDIILQQGQNTNLDAGFGFATYSWSTGAMTQTITVNSQDSIGSLIAYSVTVTDNAGCTATDAVFVTTIVSTNDPDDKYRISVTPNPTHGVVSITCEGSSTSSVQLIDNLGRVVSEDNAFAPDGAIRTLNLAQLPPSTYYIRIVGKRFTKTVSIIRQ